MGHKITPVGLRLGINQKWNSEWVATTKNTALWLKEAELLRTTLKKKLASAFIAKIEIHRQNNNIHLLIHSSRLGSILGQKGRNLERITEWSQKVLKNKNYKIKIEVLEERNAGLNAQIIAEDLAYRIANRENYRQVQQKALRTGKRLGVLGMKIIIGGRLNGADIARRSSISFGKLPLSTLKIRINYGSATSATTYGKIGIKVWVYKAENYFLQPKL